MLLRLNPADNRSAPPVRKGSLISLRAAECQTGQARAMCPGPQSFRNAFSSPWPRTRWCRSR